MVINMTIRPAAAGDFESIMNIYSYARERMRLTGNPTNGARTGLCLKRCGTISGRDRLMS